MTHRRQPYKTDDGERRRIVTDETGAAMLEWALLVALIAIVALVALSAFGGEVSELFISIADTVNSP